jgi:hypothetical protein
MRPDSYHREYPPITIHHEQGRAPVRINGDRKTHQSIQLGHHLKRWVVWARESSLAGGFLRVSGETVVFEEIDKATQVEHGPTHRQPIYPYHRGRSHGNVGQFKHVSCERAIRHEVRELFG